MSSTQSPLRRVRQLLTDRLRPDLESDPSRHVLLFFRNVETDRFVPYDRYLKRFVRPIYNRFSKSPKISGFELWYRLLCDALESTGSVVHRNRWRLARRHPKHPVGLVGYPHLLDGWSLPNPAILGPALLDDPLQQPDLMKDERFRSYVVTCDWMYDLFAPAYGADVVRRWHASIDVDHWTARPMADKPTDVLVYDKIRWDRDEVKPSLLDPILQRLQSEGRSFTTIVYGSYDHEMYRRALSECRVMIFLCEHETQGMAYQEAMASGLPILAWDPGTWRDDRYAANRPEPVATTSVPFFSDECGLRFQTIDQFDAAFDDLWARRQDFRPRAYVQRELSKQSSADAYLAIYRSAIS